MDTIEMGDVVYPGDGIVATAKWSVDDVPTDPTTVAFKVLHPTGAIDTYSGAQVDHAGAGIYRLTFAAEEPGDWTLEAIGTGAAARTLVANFRVYPLPIP